MSRELKFRVWDKENKLWVAGWNIGQSGVYVDDAMSVFMQYTGLKDKNGKEIYESDIITFDRGFTDQAVVRFGSAMIDDNEHYCTNSVVGYYLELPGSDCRHLDHQETFEVIGNIYENPELVK